MTSIKKLQPTHKPQLEVLPNYRDKLLLATSEKLQVIKKNTIRFMKSYSNYCEIHYNEKEKIICSKTLKSVEERLHNPLFVRVHQSYVVNLTFINAVSPSYASVYLEDGTTIPISKANRGKIKIHLAQMFD